MNIISENIKRELSTKKMSQKDLCEKTGISESAMSKYLSSNRPVRTDILMKIANALGTSAYQLMGLKLDDKETFETCKTALLARSGSNLSYSEKQELINLILEHK